MGSPIGVNLAQSTLKGARKKRHVFFFEEEEASLESHKHKEAHKHRGDTQKNHLKHYSTLASILFYT